MKPDGPVFNKAWRESCDVIPATKASVNWMVRRHYLKRWPAICTLILAMRHDKEFVGMVIYSLPPRGTLVRYGMETWELARLWVDDTVPHNAETWLISQSVRHIKTNHPAVRLLVSYADPSVNHSGTIYKAANWTKDGRTDDNRKAPRFDFEDVETGVRYSRQNHVRDNAVVRRLYRVSKFRFVYRMPSSRLAVAYERATSSQSDMFAGEA